MISHQRQWTRGFVVFTACALVTTIAANVHAELLRNNLISYWQLNDGSGTTAADTAATLAGGGGSVADDGMLRGSPTWISGIFGAGVQFDGATQDIFRDDVGARHGRPYESHNAAIHKWRMVG